MGLKDQIEKGVDEILNELLVNIQNQNPDIGVSKGSMVYITEAAHAAAHWGARQAIRYVLRQMHPETADTVGLERFTGRYGLVRAIGETDAGLLARLLTRIRKPPSGGNADDYIAWAREASTYIADAYCFSIDPDIGSIGVLLLASESATGSETPTSHTAKSGTATSVSAGKLVDVAATFTTWVFAPGDEVTNSDTGETAIVTTVDSETALSLDTDIFTGVGQAWSARSLTTQVKDYILGVCPVDVHSDRLSMITPVFTPTNVTMTVTGADKTAVKSSIEAYMIALGPGEVMPLARLYAIAIREGASNATISAPGADVAPGDYELVRPGTVTVN